MKHRQENRQMKGTVLTITEVDIPEGCHSCSQVDSSGRCIYTGLYIPGYIGDGRAPHCPILPIPIKEMREMLIDSSI